MPTLTNDRQEQFAQHYARLGNATHALKAVLGNERAERMQPHSLRARANELKNNYKVVERVDEILTEMRERGEVIPHFRPTTWSDKKA
ncbi:hypothetical protein A4G19_14345 [Pasteurellaceae bacterium Macca]|nr:hypothetical protein [Pasteurellaceae bacterium Macca]MCK3655999.1 hypothetical protein [Pasteurellaceae bacterium Macca]MCK3656020.1 hypothetical protein [Pasteurellaceae bacterium Macca]MCK3656035.1 hypothetical protein [Pasteurellaceae bacterium Macca]MCK3656067.1 hypothetical protein [Pasteurellaceae bacterium Macca]